MFLGLLYSFKAKTSHQNSILSVFSKYLEIISINNLNMNKTHINQLGVRGIRNVSLS